MISQIGDRFTQMAFIELLGKEFFGSFSAFGGIAVVFTLPSILLGPVVGPLIDSWRKKKVLLVGDMVRGLLVISLPLVYTSSLLQSAGKSWNLMAMLAVALVVYIFGFFFSSARLAFVPLLVEKDRYLEANSANMTVLRLATGVGTLVGGVVVHFIGWRLGFIFDALTYFVSFILILLIRVQESPKVINTGTVSSAVKLRIRDYRERFKQWYDYILNLFSRAYIQFSAFPLMYFSEMMKPHLKEIAEGAKLMTRTRVMAYVMTSILVLFFISGVAFTVIVPTVQQTLGMGTLGVTILAAAVAGGMFLGPFFTGLFGSAFRRSRLMLVSYIFIGIAFGIGGGGYLIVGLERALAPGLVHWVLISIMGVVLFASGIFFSAINISQDTLIQELIPQEARGRLFAWREALASLAFVVTAVPAGFIAERVSFQYVLLAVGAIVILFSLAWAGFIWKVELSTPSKNGDQP